MKPCVLSLRVLSQIFEEMHTLTRWRSISGWIALAAGLLVPLESQAFPLPKATDARPAFTADFATQLQGTVDFTAIVALSNCSASLVRLTSSLPDDHALVLTNGHCNENGFTPPGEFAADIESSRTMTLLASNGRSELGTLHAERIVYVTMTKTDILLYRLRETYGEIERQYGARALTLRPSHPDANEQVAVVSGYWRKIYRCSIKRFVHELDEDDHVFQDSLRYSQQGCKTIDGTSGSPILDANTREVVGINNTINEDGEECTLNNPCEIDASGHKVWQRGARYGQETFWIYSCIDPAHGQLDLTRPGCKLPHSPPSIKDEVTR